MPEVKRVENLKFTYLKAIGIILVVLGHSGGVSLLYDWFPYYSFHISLFFFVSGYFFKDSYSFFAYFKKRFSRLVLPYYYANLFYGMLILVGVSVGAFTFGKKIGLENFFLEPWTTAHQYFFNGPAWFILCLFLVQVIYIALRLLFKRLKITNEFVLAGVFLLFGLLGTFLAKNEDTRQTFITLIRVLFGLPFIQFGYLYKEKLERWDKPSVFSFALLFSFQAFLFIQYGDVNYLLLTGNFNNNVLLPFLASLTGIWFWLMIAEILSQQIKKSALFSYIGNNSFTILTHHYFGFWVLNSIFFLLELPNFDIINYRSSIAYKYLFFAEPHSMILYLVAGVSIPLALKFFYDNHIANVLKRNLIGEFRMFKLLPLRHIK